MTDHSPHVPRISVIVPARNEAPGITACLCALTVQDIGEEFEILVVDNGSDDATAQLAAAFPVTVISEPRTGRAVARNTGIQSASGDILAFIDADCIPRPSWLRELLAGSDDAEYACFVGEIVPLKGSGTVSRYVHERGLICQLRLLSQAPPVAATGNIAYRRDVFNTIGMFDETFEFGEDGDLFWRMVRSRRFRYRYNAGAIVAHKHPERVGEFLHRSFREGTGLGRFRRKHRADLPPALTSKAHTAFLLAMTLAGSALYPLRVARGLSLDRDVARRAVTYPLLDKVGAIGRLAGALNEHARGPKFPSAPAGSDCDDPGAFRDRTVMDLDQTVLLCTGGDAIRRRVRSELKTIGTALAGLFPHSSVLLTGSLFADEGRAGGPDDSIMQSDYDFFIVTSRLPDAIPSFARRRIEALMDTLPSRCADMEIGIIWRPLLDRHLTTVGGAVIAGAPDIAETLRGLPAPSAFSALLQAYRALTTATIDPSGYARKCASALVRAGRALMFQDAMGRPRREWISCFSIEVVGEKIHEWRPVLGRETVEVISGAAAFQLGLLKDGPAPEDHQLHVRILEGISARIRMPGKGVFIAKQFHRTIMTRSARLRTCFDTKGILRCFQHLAASWTPDGPDEVRLRNAEDVFGRLGLPQPPTTAAAETYRHLQRTLSEAAGYNPHRVFCPKEGT